MRFSKLIKVSCLQLLLLPLIALLGCSEIEKIEFPESSLQGVVKYKGKPVPHALIIVNGNGIAAQGFADKDGNFLVERVPIGDVTIGVNTKAGRGNMMGDVMSAQQRGVSPPTFVDVPEKYFAPSSSGISFKITDPKGVNSFDIELN